MQSAQPHYYREVSSSIIVQMCFETLWSLANAGTSTRKGAYEAGNAEDQASQLPLAASR